MPAFALHPRLAADSHGLGRFELCNVRLMDDRRWPWLLLVPQRPAIIEWHDLGEADVETLSREIRRASAAMKNATGCTKINVAALGNVVAQLHVHVIARNEGDPNWPGPVWGFGERLAYGVSERAALAEKIGRGLAATGVFHADPL